MNKIYRLIKNRVSGIVQVAPEFARAHGKTSAVGLGLTALLIAPGAMAASFEIVNGETVTTQQILGDGETGVIQSGGSLDTGEDTAIDVLGANVTVTNNGSISTTDDLAYGIYSDSVDTTITNSGSISTTGPDADGIRIDGLSATVTNSGSISTTGGVAYGIYSSGDNATLSNSGSISTTGLTAYGIRATGANTTITNSGTVSTTQDSGFGISGEGANTTITNSGSISTTGFDGVGINAFGADATITNSGSISTEGMHAYGINSEGDYATISNSGSISTEGMHAYGIYAYDAYATITNSGTIGTAGDSAYGIYAYGANATVTNRGSISTTGSSGYGILSEGDNATISNSGTISTTGSLAHGIYSTVGNATITNSGTISTTGGDARGIYSEGGNTTINNNGRIITTGDDSHGILLLGDNVTFNNSGLISSTGLNSFAILGGEDANDTVNILPGSRILGAIDLGDGIDTANIHGTHGSAVMRLDNTEIINLHAPNAVLVGGDMVVVVEPTGESSRGIVLDGLTSGIHNVLNRRMQGTRPIVPIELASLEMSPGMLYQERAPYAWGQVFGSKGSRDGDGQMLDLDTRVSGVVGGYERDWRDGRIGVMVGAASSSADTDTTKQESDTLFAGIYGQAFLGWANLSASLIVGSESHDQDRLVLDNLNGYETARSSTDSLFVSPSLALSRSYTLNPTTELRPSATVSYSMARYDGYTETGTTNANMTVDSRTVEALSGRIQGELVHAVSAGEVSLRLGLQARRTDSDAIKMSVGGNNLRFDAMGDKHAAGGYLGFGARLNIGKQLHLLADVEAGHMSGGEEQLAGQLTLQYPF